MSGPELFVDSTTVLIVHGVEDVRGRRGGGLAESAGFEGVAHPWDVENAGDGELVEIGATVVECAWCDVGLHRDRAEGRVGGPAEAPFVHFRDG